MANRITRQDIDAMLRRLCSLTGLQALEWEPCEGGHGNRCNVGALFVEPGSRANGIAWKLCVTVNNCGAQQTVLHAATAAELHSQMQAYAAGWDDAKRGVRS